MATREFVTLSRVVFYLCKNGQTGALILCLVVKKKYMFKQILKQLLEQVLKYIHQDILTFCRKPECFLLVFLKLKN